MKFFAKLLVKIISYSLSKVVPLRFIKAFQYFNNLFNTHIHEVSFMKCGTGLYLESPSSICGGKNIVVGNGFQAKARLRIEVHDTYPYSKQRFTPSIEIKNGVTMGYDCHIACINKIVIGNNVLFASKIFITDHFHGLISETDIDVIPQNRPLYSKGEIVIEDSVWIGQNVTILPGVVIGKQAIIGSNSVVTKSIPPYSVAVGNPARVVKYLKK